MNVRLQHDSPANSENAPRVVTSQTSQDSLQALAYQTSRSLRDLQHGRRGARLGQKHFSSGSIDRCADEWLCYSKRTDGRTNYTRDVRFLQLLPIVVLLWVMQNIQHQTDHTRTAPRIPQRPTHSFPFYSVLPSRRPPRNAFWVVLRWSTHTFTVDATDASDCPAMRGFGEA